MDSYFNENFYLGFWSYYWWLSCMECLVLLLTFFIVFTTVHLLLRTKGMQQLNGGSCFAFSYILWHNNLYCEPAQMSSGTGCQGEVTLCIRTYILHWLRFQCIIATSQCLTSHQSTAVLDLILDMVTNISGPCCIPYEATVWGATLCLYGKGLWQQRVVGFISSGKNPVCKTACMCWCEDGTATHTRLPLPILHVLAWREHITHRLPWGTPQATQPLRAGLQGARQHTQGLHLYQRVLRLCSCHGGSHYTLIMHWHSPYCLQVPLASWQPMLPWSYPTQPPGEACPPGGKEQLWDNAGSNVYCCCCCTWASLVMPLETPSGETSRDGTRCRGHLWKVCTAWGWKE